MSNKTFERAHAMLDKARKSRASAIMRRVDKGETIAEIARDMGVSRQRVSAIVQGERAKVQA